VCGWCPQETADVLKAQLDQQAQAADTIINNMRVMEGKLAGKPAALHPCC